MAFRGAPGARTRLSASPQDPRRWLLCGRAARGRTAQMKPPISVHRGMAGHWQAAKSARRERKPRASRERAGVQLSPRGRGSPMPPELRGAQGCAGAGQSRAAASACISKRGNSCPPARPYPTWRRGSGGIELIPTILLAACRARARGKASGALHPAVCAMPLPLHGVPPPWAPAFMADTVGRGASVAGLEL